MAHAQGLEGVKQCVAAGIHSIEHGIYLDEAVVLQMIEQGTYLVPTLLAPVSVLEFAEELGMSMVKYGMSEIDAIRASTITAAECLCLDNVGQIKSGYLADVILVKEDPLKDISVLKDTDNIKIVIKDGDIVKSI